MVLTTQLDVTIHIHIQVVKEGSPRGLHPVIVDDLVRSGGTLANCANVLREQGARDVSCFVAHAVFPRQSWKKFVKGGSHNVFKNFWVTNSVPHVTEELPEGDCFKVLDILPLVIKDL